MLTGIRLARLGHGRQDPGLQGWAGLSWATARLTDPVPVPDLERADNTSFLCSWLLVGRERPGEGLQACIPPRGFRGPQDQSS